MPFFQAKDGTELFYTSWGDGLPVVLVHGNNIGSDMWSFQIAHLIEKGFRCISYDQRGFGRSDAPSSGYDADTLAGDLHSLIETLGLSKTSLIAYSIGAGVVARFLSRFGTNSIDRIILLSPVTPCFLKTNDNPEGLEAEVTYGPFRSGLISDRPQLLRDSLDAFFNPDGAEDPVSEGFRNWIVTSSLQNPLLPVLEFTRISYESDFRPDMKSFTIPTLIVHGAADAFAPSTVTADRTHNMIRKSHLVKYEGASHGLIFTHRMRVNRDIIEFLAPGLRDLNKQVDR